jgi:heme A synthase
MDPIRHQRKDLLMRKTYSVLAWILVGGVFVQAASIAFGFGGMAGFVQDGGVVDKALVESGTASNFTGELGFPIHEIVGGMVIPLAALALLVVSFFVKVRGARMWAAIMFGLVFVQIMLGYSIVDVPYLGLVHGANALAVLLTAVYAARLPGRVETADAASTSTTRVPV